MGDFRKLLGRKVTPSVKHPFPNSPTQPRGSPLGPCPQGTQQPTPCPLRPAGAPPSLARSGCPASSFGSNLQV